jgi:hypothetical protein
MKFRILFSAIVITLFVAACGPAAEDREKMHNRAKEFQDSIANVIRTSFAEAESPAPAMMVPPPTATAGTPAAAGK